MAAQMSAADRKKLKVQELRDELSTLGLDTSGTKAVLLERLEAALVETAGDEEDKKEVEAAGDDDKKASVEEELEDVPLEVEAELGKLDDDGANDDLVDEQVNKDTKELSEIERRKLRAEKFGTVLSEQDKLLLRKEKFGTNGATPNKTEEKPKIVQVELSEEEKLKRKKRMERFGLERSGIEELQLQKEMRRNNKKMKTSKKSSEVSEFDIKMKARQDRFGTTGSKEGVKVIDSEFERKKAERAKRFGL